MTEFVLVTGSSHWHRPRHRAPHAQAGHDIVLHCRSGVTGRQAFRLKSGWGAPRILQFDVADRKYKMTDVRKPTVLAWLLNAGLTRGSAFRRYERRRLGRWYCTNLDGFYNVHRVMMPIRRRAAFGRIVCASPRCQG